MHGLAQVAKLLQYATCSLKAVPPADLSGWWRMARSPAEVNAPALPPAQQSGPASGLARPVTTVKVFPLRPQRNQAGRRACRS